MLLLFLINMSRRQLNLITVPVKKSIYNFQSFTKYKIRNEIKKQKPQLNIVQYSLSGNQTERERRTILFNKNK